MPITIFIVPVQELRLGVTKTPDSRTWEDPDISLRRKCGGNPYIHTMLCIKLLAYRFRGTISCGCYVLNNHNRIDKKLLGLSYPLFGTYNAYRGLQEPSRPIHSGDDGSQFPQLGLILGRELGCCLPLIFYPLDSVYLFMDVDEISSGKLHPALT